MRYSALYQKWFTDTRHSFGQGSHVFAAALEAATLDDAFEKLQAEFMDQPTLSSVAASPALHTSLSVGDALLDEEGNFYIVASVGFEHVEPGNVEDRAEVALHMLRCGLIGTPGWHRLFREDGGVVVQRMLEQLQGERSLPGP